MSKEGLVGASGATMGRAGVRARVAVPVIGRVRPKVRFRAKNQRSGVRVKAVVPDQGMDRG